MLLRNNYNVKWMRCVLSVLSGIALSFYRWKRTENAVDLNKRKNAQMIMFKMIADWRKRTISSQRSIP